MVVGREDPQARQSYNVVRERMMLGLTLSSAALMVIKRTDKWWKLTVGPNLHTEKGVKKKEAHFICHMFSCHPTDSIKAPKETQVLSRKHNTNPVNNLASFFLHLAPNS